MLLVFLTTMSSLNSLKTHLIVLYITCTIMIITPYTTLALKTPTMLKMSTIAAEPAVLPYTLEPASAPAMSPGITPLFPTPSSTASPDSSLPVIPSSPSPPNPDDSLSGPHPELSIAPNGSIPESSAFGPSLSGSLSLAMLVLVSIALL